MGAKIAQAREQHVPYMLIVGDRDVEAGTVSVRLRTDEDLGALPLADFRARVVGVVADKALGLG
jgi:threonyl-tRNA synthetase